MADLEQIMGGTNPNVQPKDNPDPSKEGEPAPIPAQPNQPQPRMTAPPDAVQAPAPAANPQLSPALGSVGPTPPPMGAVPSPASPEDAEDAKNQKRVEEVIAKLSKGTPKAEKQKLDDIDARVDGLISKIKGPQSDSLAKGTTAIESNLEGDSFWGGYLRNQRENAKVLITKVRAQLENDPAMKAGIFGQMYGQENVRQNEDGTFQFRPEKSRKWRDIDAPQSDAFTDFFTTNVLKALPMAANMLTQVGGNILTKGSLPGQIAAGAAGGAVDATVSEGIKSAVDPLLGINPEREDLLGQIATEAGYNAAAPVAFRAAGLIGKAALATGSGVLSSVGNMASKIPQVQAAASTIAEGLRPVTGAFLPQVNPGEVSAANLTSKDISTLKDAKWWNQKYAQVREGFNSFREIFFPHAAQDAAEVGAQIAGPRGAMQVAQDRLGAKIGLYKNEAIALANQTGKKSPMENGTAAIKDILQKNGLYFNNPETGLMEAVEGADVDLVPGATRSAMDKMAALYNRIQKSNTGDGGTELKRIMNDNDLIAPLARYDSRTATSSDKDVASLWGRVDGAFRADRDNLMNDVFTSSESVYKDQWKSDFKQYAQNADAIWNVKSNFHSPQELQMMVNTFAQGSNPTKNELLDNIATVVGKDSQEFKNLQGAIVGNIMDKFSKNGPVNTSQLLTFLNDKKNASFINRLLDPKEKAILTNMAVAGDQASQRAALSESNKDKLVRGTGWLSSAANDGYAGAKQIFQILKGDKATVDWMRHEGFALAAKKAEGQGMKQRILKASAATEDMIQHMAIIDVPVYLKDGSKNTIKRYAPYAGPAIAATAESQMQPD